MAEAPQGEAVFTRHDSKQASNTIGQDDVRCVPAMQATRIQIVLANGTVQDFTPQSIPHLWRAVQVRL